MNFCVLDCELLVVAPGVVQAETHPRLDGYRIHPDHSTWCPIFQKYLLQGTEVADQAERHTVPRNSSSSS